MRETIKSASGKTLGYKVEVGSRTIVQDASGKTLGHYEKNQDKTFDKSGRVRYSGNQTSALIADESE